MRFCKMNGIGNDYVYIDLTKEKVENPGGLAVKLSDRHFAIGADGLVLIDKGADTDFTMRMFNPDGSEGEMCGNAIRCVGKYVYDKGYTDKLEISVKTLAGVKNLRLDLVDGVVDSVRVDMGEPVIKSECIPVITDEPYFIDKEISIGVRQVRITCVSMGNPHAVIFADCENADMELGKAISNHPVFPKRTNVEFASVSGRREIKVRVYERGTGETLACGTGACAAFYAAHLLKKVDDSVTVKLPGGDLKIELINKRIYMTGKARFNYEGEIFV